MFKVLIVEDEHIIREGIKHLIDWTKLDCVIFGEAANGVEGIKEIENQQPDIVLMDINMPIKNGIEMLEECQANHTFCTIVISGYDEFDYAKRALRLGVTEYLLKPIEKQELIRAVDRAKQNLAAKKEYQMLKRNLKTPDKVNVLDVNTWKKYNHRIKYVDQMVQYIQNHYHEKISINDLPDELGMSVTYLNQNFKKGTGYTFNEFLNRYRIEKAIERIKIGEDKITIIATDVGYSNYRYFINVFKKYTSFLPSDFHSFK